MEINIKIIITDDETGEELAKKESYTFEGAMENLGKLERYLKEKNLWK